MKSDPIVLTSEARHELERYSTTGSHSTRLVRRAKVILALDTSEGRRAMKQREIMEKENVSRQAIGDMRRDYLSAESASAFLQRKKRETPPVEPKVTGELEARVIALACGEVPAGRSKWTLRMLADKCVELDYIDAISHMTISRLLKKHNLNLT